MEVPKNWILCIIYLVSMLDGAHSSVIDNKEYFCGKKLVEVLADLCAFYNSPFDNYSRNRRHIVEECCRSQCSRRYLVQYYCSKAKSSVVEELSKPPSNETELSKNSKSSHASGTANELENPGKIFTVGRRKSHNQQSQLVTSSSPSHQSSELEYHRNFGTHYVSPSSSSASSFDSNSDVKPARRRLNHCRCRRRRVKRVKKSRQILDRGRMNRPPAPPPNIGQIENSQKPFYVWRFSHII